MSIGTDKVQTSVYSVVVNVFSIHPTLFCIEPFKLTVYVVQDGDATKDKICILISFSYDDVMLGKQFKAIVMVQFGFSI